jgi:ubiquinol-cytochrome c reductase iron-sulfur subunit
MSTLNRRLLLTRLLKLLTLCGLGFVAYPFFAALLPDAGVTDQRRAQWEYDIDLSGIQPGELMIIDHWPGGSVAVYRRTQHELDGLSRNVAQLHDPDSVHSRQPDALRSTTRAKRDDYFVFVPLDTDRGCQIRYIPSNKQPKPDIDWYGGFSEPCTGSLYDTAGRVYRAYRTERQQNLSVPRYRSIGPQRLQLTGPTP